MSVDVKRKRSSGLGQRQEEDEVSDNFQKMKMLKLYELLSQETDEEHPMTTNQIIEKLREMNITCDRRTLAKDIDAFEQHGYEIMQTKVSRENAYYIADRSFDVAELKILIDAVQASSFITPKKTEDLIQKIASLGGSHKAEVLKANMVSFRTRKHKNEMVYYSVERLGQAIDTRKKASFLYFDIDEHGQKSYRKDGERYIVEPLALIFHEDNYYLMCYSSKYQGITNYRVDRMEKLEVEQDGISAEAKRKINVKSIANYTEQSFKMFGGDVSAVTLEIDNDCIGAVYDKFGEDTKLVRVAANALVTSVKVQVSPPFFGWIAQFGGKIKVLSPEDVRNDFIEHIEKARSQHDSTAH